MKPKKIRAGDAKDPSRIMESLRSLAVPVANLKTDPANARTHDERNLAAVEASLRRFGQQKPIVVDAGGVVIAGNATLEAARRLGWTHLAAVRSALTGPDRAAYAVADNRTAELAEWDEEALGKLLAEIQADEGALAATGFDEEEIERFLAVAEGGGANKGLTDPDAVPEPPKKAITRPGDLWILGQHRLLCGDSTKAEDVARMMRGEKAVLMATDPPYGAHISKVNADRAEINRTRHWDEIEGDAFEGDALKDFLEKAFRLAADVALRENAAWYLWHAQMTQGFFAAAAAANLVLHRQIIWVKPSLILGHGHYHWRHELCFYGWREGHMCPWYGDRKADTIWEIGKENSEEWRGAARKHPTQKPVELWDSPIVRNTRPGEIVYEPFAGSGSQFIAAEQLGRRCFGLEISPLYCDVIVRRWEEFTGKKAMLEKARPPRRIRRG